MELYNALEKNNLSEIHNLIKNGTKVDNNSFKYCRSSEAINLLLHEGADINYKNEFGLSLLTWSLNKPKLFKLFLDAGVNPNLQNCNNETTLFVMLKKPIIDLIMVRTLLNNKADLSLQKNNGHNVLHYAVSRGNVDLIKLLLEFSIIC